MNIMKKLLILIVLLVSCKVTTTRKAKIDFKLETKESLEYYLSENDVDYSANHLYSLKDIQTFAEFNDQEKLSLPEVLFFNENGLQVKNAFNNKECTTILSDFEVIDNLEVDPAAWDFDTLLKKLHPLHSREVKKGNNSVVIFYGKYVSNEKSINKQSFEWYKEISKAANAKSNINILLASLDVMENWNLTEETKRSIGIQ